MALLCVVRGDSASAVWYRYNETLDEYIKLTTDSGKYSFSQEGSEFILSFSSASSADTGVYRCEGLSPAGRIDKDFNFYSLVAPSNTYIRGSNNGQFFGFSGDDLQLTCVSEVCLFVCLFVPLVFSRLMEQLPCIPSVFNIQYTLVNTNTDKRNIGSDSVFVSEYANTLEPV